MPEAARFDLLDESPLKLSNYKLKQGPGHGTSYDVSPSDFLVFGNLYLDSQSHWNAGESDCVQDLFWLSRELPPAMGNDESATVEADLDFAALNAQGRLTIELKRGNSIWSITLYDRYASSYNGMSPPIMWSFAGQMITMDKIRLVYDAGGVQVFVDGKEMGTVVGARQSALSSGPDYLKFVVAAGNGLESDRLACETPNAAVTFKGLHVASGAYPQ